MRKLIQPELKQCKTCARWIISEFHVFKPFCVNLRFGKKCNYYSIKERNKRLFAPAEGRGYARAGDGLTSGRYWAPPSG